MQKAYQPNASTLSSSTLPYLITAIVLAVIVAALLVMAVLQRRKAEADQEKRLVVHSIFIKFMMILLRPIVTSSSKSPSVSALPPIPDRPSQRIHENYGNQSRFTSTMYFKNTFDLSNTSYDRRGRIWLAPITVQRNRRQLHFCVHCIVYKWVSCSNYDPRLYWLSTTENTVEYIRARIKLQLAESKYPLALMSCKRTLQAKVCPLLFIAG